MDIRLKSKIEKITTFVFDVDGVFTDASLIVSDSSVDRVFNVRDGYAVQMAMKSGYNLAVISGGKQESIRTRLAGLGIQEIALSVSTDGKPAEMQKLIDKWGLKEEEILYIGDDIPDLLLMNAFKVLKVCPADAENEVKEIVDYMCETKGGKGAVREVIKLIMKEQHKWMKVF